MSDTHYGKQRRVEHSCGRTIRLKPERNGVADNVVWCGKCNEHFEYGELL